MLLSVKRFIIYLEAPTVTNTSDDAPTRAKLLSTGQSVQRPLFRLIWRSRWLESSWERCGELVSGPVSLEQRNGWRGVLDEGYLLGLEEIMEVVELLKRDDSEYSIRFNRKRLTVDEMAVMVVETRKRAKTMEANMVDLDTVVWRLGESSPFIWINVHRDRERFFSSTCLNVIQLMERMFKEHQCAYCLFVHGLKRHWSFCGTLIHQQSAVLPTSAHNQVSDNVSGTDFLIASHQGGCWMNDSFHGSRPRSLPTRVGCLPKDVKFFLRLHLQYTIGRSTRQMAHVDRWGVSGTRWRVVLKLRQNERQMDSCSTPRSRSNGRKCVRNVPSERIANETTLNGVG